MKTISSTARTNILILGGIATGIICCYFMSATAYAGVGLVAPVLLAALIDAVL